MSDDATKEEPWICPGYTEEHEDELIGNREGFRLLKAKIDEVLESGRIQVKEPGVEWIGLKLVAEDPRKAAQRGQVACRRIDDSVTEKLRRPAGA